MSMPVKVFGPPGFANVWRVLVCLEEVGAKFKVVNVNVVAGEHKSPEHLLRNPFGKIPAFQDGDLVLFGSDDYIETVSDPLQQESNLQQEEEVDPQGMHFCELCGGFDD